MLIDEFGREIYYLRISVTDRCNYRCRYCMPTDVVLKTHNQMLRYEEIAAIADAAGKLGFYKIRLTGGEPLIKKNIEHLVKLIADTGYYRDISMTTNGSLLTPEKANALRVAGLHRINISLDTLDPVYFSEITGGGNINDVLYGIEAAVGAGFCKVKINMVISKSTTQLELDAMRVFCSKQGLQLQLIALFSLHDRNDIAETNIITDRPPKCSSCNRIRITADGFIKSCLFSDDEYKVDLDNIRQSLTDAVQRKPELGITCKKRAMSQIGG